MQNNFLIIHVRASTKKKHSSGQDVPRDNFFAKERRVFVRPNFDNFYTIRVINKSGPALKNHACNGTSLYNITCISIKKKSWRIISV